MSKPVDVGSLRVGGYMVIDDQPCRIVDITKSKPGKHGAAKARIVAIGTPVYLKPGIISLADDLTTRDLKLNHVKATIGSQTLDIALGDTFADIPLLEQARQSIAVFPDRILRRTALERGWQILE